MYPLLVTRPNLEVATNKLFHQHVKSRCSFSAVHEYVSTAIYSGVDISEVSGCNLLWIFSQGNKGYFIKDWCLSLPPFEVFIQIL